MNKNTIIVILAVAVLILLTTFFAGSKETQAPGPEENVPGTSEVINKTTGTTKSPTTAPSAPKTSTVAPGAVTTEEPVVVVYTGDRFTPSIAVIKRGQKIIFLNQSDNDMRVMSDPHPTHSALPELNQGQAVARGGTHQFVFTKTGKWTYHNEANTSRKGTVVVNYD